MKYVHGVEKSVTGISGVKIRFLIAARLPSFHKLPNCAVFLGPELTLRRALQAIGTFDSEEMKAPKPKNLCQSFAGLPRQIKVKIKKRSLLGFRSNYFPSADPWHGAIMPNGKAGPEYLMNYHDTFVNNIRPLTSSNFLKHNHKVRYHKILMVST